MARLPAICDRCGTIFPSGYGLGNGTSGVMFEGNKSGPCPECGAMGTVPDGIYGVIDGLIKFARAGELPGDRLAMLGEMAITAKAEGWSSDQFRAEAEKREPGSAGLLAWMPSNKVEWFTFIGLLIMALQLMQASSGYTLKNLLQPAPEPVPGPVAAMTRRVTDSTPKVAPSRIAPKPKAAGRHKIGRNDPCHCGSGIKYKRCHGALN